MQKNRFWELEGLRGVAAIVVVAYHGGMFLGTIKTPRLNKYIKTISKNVKRLYYRVNNNA